MKARVTRIAANSPDDVSGLAAAIEAGYVSPSHVVAILGKTEGNGCVNDFTRGYATDTLKRYFASVLGQTASEVERNIVFVMSGGTEGGLSPHWLVFEADPSADSKSDTGKYLAIGTAVTREFQPHEVGRKAQVLETAQAVRAAMNRALIESPDDVHYVQVKCPLLTKARIAKAKDSGNSVATYSTLDSMGYSRGASALGVAVALGEITEDQISDDVICSDYSLFSSRASTSAGVELLENQILVVGNSSHWSGDLIASHDVMSDAIDADALLRAIAAAGVGATYPMMAEQRENVLAVLVKAEASRTGTIRGSRHTMLDDSDIPGSRHARALVGGVLSGAIGCTDLFVSGGAEHQGPDGGGPLAVIIRKASYPPSSPDPQR